MAIVTLTVVHDELEAEMLCGLLQTNGIPCYYRSGEAGTALATWAPGVFMGGPMDVLVNEQDLERARELLPP